MADEPSVGDRSAADPSTRASAPLDDPADAAALASYADALVDAVDAVVARWVAASILSRAADAGVPIDAELRATIDAVAQRTRDELVVALRELLVTDVDEQRTTPLALVRDSTRHASALLDELGVPAAERDEFAQRSFPGDRHDLAPASMRQVDESLHEPSMVWGAAKAHIHLRRRRAEGRR